MTWKVFDSLADRYDAWFESERGSAIFAAEAECVRSMLPQDLSGWVEVGLGTGRFAEALGILEGVDPSASVLEKAEKRGIKTGKAAAENLPYPDASLEGVLLVVTLCFLRDPAKALLECERVLKPGGGLLAGIVPAESPWGKFYRKKAKDGHPFYSVARFYTCEETRELAEGAGFRFAGAASTLLKGPAEEVEEMYVATGTDERAGFVSMLFHKKAE